MPPKVTFLAQEKTVWQVSEAFANIQKGRITFPKTFLSGHSGLSSKSSRKPQTL